MRVTKIDSTLKMINLAYDAVTTATSSSAKVFIASNLTDDEYTAPVKVGTFELNRFILDGTFQHQNGEALSSSYINFLSSNQSDDDCIFGTDTYINIAFTNSAGAVYPQNLIGLSIDFGYFPPASINIAYTLSSSVVITKDFDVTVDSGEQFFKFISNQCNSIKITYLKSKFPKEFAYMQHITFGRILSFNDETVKSCNIHEENNLISAKVVPSTCEMDFYIIESEWNELQDELFKNQKLQLYCKYTDDDEEYETRQFLGNYYLDYWERKDDNITSFKFVSFMGVADKRVPNTGRAYLVSYNDVSTVTTVGTALKNIFSYLNLKPADFYIDPEIENLQLKGYSPRTSYKEAIQRIAFSAGAQIIDNSGGERDIRGSVVKIARYNPDVISVIPETRVFEGVKDIKNEIVTGLEITYYNYLPSKSTFLEDSEKIFEGYLSVGSQTIYFTKPVYCFNWPPSGVTDFSTRPTYAKINVTTAGYYTFTGHYFIEMSSIKSVTFSEFSGYQPNILKIENNQYINSSNVDSLAEYWSNYYKKYGLAQEFEFLSVGETTGNFAMFRGSPDHFNTGCIISQDIDVANGFTSKCKTIAVNKIEEKAPFMGQGLYGGSRFGLV